MSLAMRFALLLFCHGAFLQTRSHFAKEHSLKIAKATESSGFSNKTGYKNRDFHFAKRIYNCSIPMLRYMSKKFLKISSNELDIFLLERIIYRYKTNCKEVSQ